LAKRCAEAALLSKERERGSLRIPFLFTETKSDYFFFAFPLLADFFEDDLAADFLAVAIEFTTFHAVRDLTVAPIWQKSANRFAESLNVVGRTTRLCCALRVPASRRVLPVLVALTIVLKSNMRTLRINVKCFCRKMCTFSTRGQKEFDKALNQPRKIGFVLYWRNGAWRKRAKENAAFRRR
jgi:hypothetical protein